MKKITLLIAAFLLCIGVVLSGGNPIIQNSEIGSNFKSAGTTDKCEIFKDLCEKEAANLNIESQQLTPKLSFDKSEVIEADCGCWRHLIQCGGARPLTQCIRDYLDCVLSCDI